MIAITTSNSISVKAKIRRRDRDLALHIVFSVASFALWLPPTAVPGDWPQFRGPNRDGLSAETGLLQQWPAGGPTLAWKATGLGSGYSTLSIVGNRIFTIGDKGDSSFGLALNV